MFERSTYDRPRFGFGSTGLSTFIRWMIIINVVMFLLQHVWGGMTVALGLSPRLFFADFPNRLYQVFTYMFLHGGFFHIFFNMLVLWMFGTEIEFMWGTRTFGRFYLIGGLAGALFTLMFQPGQTAVTIGASAAIYGVMVAYWLMFPQRYVIIFPLFIPVKVKWAIPGFMLLGFFFAGPGVARWAHLGGAVWGLAYLKLDWRLMRWGGALKNLRRRRQEAKLEKRRRQAEDVMRRVDQILDRINEVGIENLTPEERKFLEEASSELAGREKRSENSR